MACLESSVELYRISRATLQSRPSAEQMPQHRDIVYSILTTHAGLVPQVTYYSRVGLELGKLLVHQRGMAPP